MVQDGTRMLEPKWLRMVSSEPILWGKMDCSKFLPSSNNTGRGVGGVERERRMSKVWHESGRWIFSGRFRGSIGLVDLFGSVVGSVEGRNPVRSKCCDSQASVNLKQDPSGLLGWMFWVAVLGSGRSKSGPDELSSSTC